MGRFPKCVRRCGLLGLVLAAAGFPAADSARATGSAGATGSAKEEAMALGRKAHRAEKAGKNADAYLFYSEAAALQPKNGGYKRKMVALQSRAALQGKAAPAPEAGAAGQEAAGREALDGSGVGTTDAAYLFDSMTSREFAAARQLRPPPELKANPGRQDFDISGPPRVLFDQVAQRFGLETVYDGDYPAAGNPVRFEVAGVDYREALRDLEAATSSFVTPLSPRLFMVGQDNPSKRNDLEQTITISIPIPQVMTTQELQEISQGVRQATNIEKMAWDTANGTLVIRDRISRVLPAQALLQQLFSWRPEVMIDVEFLEVVTSHVQNYGFNVNTSIPGFYLGQILNSAAISPRGVTNLLTFGGGKTLIGLGVMEAQSLFNETRSSARTVFSAQIRAVDGQAATFHAGEKYPIITGGYYGTASSTSTASTVFRPPPSFTYEDLGVLIKLTPHVHGSGDVTLALETGYELLAGGAVNSIPVISRRQLNTQVRLRNNEWAIVAGLMNETDSKSSSGFLGLFREIAKDKEDSTVLIAIKPHLLSSAGDQVVSKAIRVGSETRPVSPL